MKISQIFNKKNTRYMLCALILAACFSLPAQSEELGEAFTNKALEILKQESTTAAAVAITKQDKVIYSQGLGELEAYSGRLVDRHSLFHVASVSKMVTAVAILKLVQDGKIDLDAPLVKYLPWFSLSTDPAIWKTITIRQLLNHNSGISREIGCVFNDDKGRFLPGLHLPECVKGQEIVFTPGSRLKYSNLGYVLLGQVVGRLQKGHDSNVNKFIKYARQNVLLPLGMTNSVYIADSYMTKNLALPYGYKITKDLRETLSLVKDTYFNAPAWGLMTNAEDIGQLLIFIYKVMNKIPNGILNAEISAEILKNPMMDQAAPATGHALGFAIKTDAQTKSRRIGHTGNFPGYSASVFVDEKTGFGVAVVVNAVERNAATAISELAFKTLIPTQEATPTRVFTPNAPEPQPEPVDDVLNGKYKSWARTVEIIKYADKTIMVIDGKNQVLKPDGNAYRQSTTGAYSGHLGERLEVVTDCGGEIVSSLLFSRSYEYKRLGPSPKCH